MQARPLRHAEAPRTLFTGPDAALISLCVHGWANSLLVQLMRLPVGRSETFSLYTLYREGSMTFEATVRFDMGESRLPLETVLTAFVRGSEYEQAVLKPLARQVRQHFHR